MGPCTQECGAFRFFVLLESGDLLWYETDTAQTEEGLKGRLKLAGCTLHFLAKVHQNPAPPAILPTSCTTPFREAPGSCVWPPSMTAVRCVAGVGVLCAWRNPTELADHRAGGFRACGGGRRERSAARPDRRLLRALPLRALLPGLNLPYLPLASTLLPHVFSLRSNLLSLSPLCCSPLLSTSLLLEAPGRLYPLPMLGALLL